MNGFHFLTLFKIPVFVSPWFIFLVVYWSYTSATLQEGLIWGLSITLSVLFHEFGHGLVSKHFKLAPRIMLHGWGGFCAHERAARDRDDALIIIAGPAANFILAGLSWGGLKLLQAINPSALSTGLLTFFGYMIAINLILGIFNLLPIWPLDGGQLFRLGLLQTKLTPVRAEKITHTTGLVLGAVMVFILAVWLRSTFGAIIIAFVAYQNLVQLQSTSSSDPIRSKNKQGKEFLAQAESALARRDWSRASQLAHQLRSLSSLDPDTMQRVWSILAIATTHEGDYERALRYADKAKPSPDVLAAKVICLVELGEVQKARELYGKGGIGNLPTDVRGIMEPN